MAPDSSSEEKSEIDGEFYGEITDRPDGWLLREWKSGDQRAAEILFDRYSIRLVALVASRLNRRFRAVVDPSEVVQSAMGSFFDAARNSRIQVSSSISLWRLLATFARRKMARSLERQATIKRGGGRRRIPLDSDLFIVDEPHAEQDAEGFLATLKSELPQDQFAVVRGLLRGQTQREVAESLGVDERTVRRRLSRVRQHLLDVGETEGPLVTERGKCLVSSSPTSLPLVNYNEFVLGKLIGSGGFGKVYRASMQGSSQTVAVKFLRKAFWQNQAARRTFLAEINLASQVTHSGVVRYLGYGESPHGGPYLISEWIDGQPLQNVMNVTPSKIVRWLRQICEALQSVHRVGLVHGDLTPSNILVDANDHITITDFGFSQATPSDANSIAGGTLGFAAPEQIDPSFGNVGPKTDIYAIGGLVYWFLFRRPPRVGTSPAEVLVDTLRSESPVSSNLPRIPRVLNDILLQTLAPAPAARTITLPQILSWLNNSSL